MHKFWKYSVFIFLFIAINASSYKRRFRKIHILDPSIEGNKYYRSWNSDQWLNWLRKRCQQFVHSHSSEPICGYWVNTVIISSEEDIEQSFEKKSMLVYDSILKANYLWSTRTFPVVVIIRKPKKVRGMNSSDDPAPSTEQIPAKNKEGNSHYRVYSCQKVQMFVNARVDLNSYKIEEIITFYPKQIRNPGDRMRVPITKCKEVTQIRGLVDEVLFNLRSSDSSI